MRLFVVSRADREEDIQEFCKYDSLIAELDTARRYVDLYCHKEFYHIYIDDSLVSNLDWKFHFKSQTNQKGLLTWIGITGLSEGLHHLKVMGPNKNRSPYSEIPFYREINANTYVPDQPLRKEDEDSDYLKLKPILPK